MSASSCRTSRTPSPSGRPRACRCNRATTTGPIRPMSPDGLKIEILEDKQQNVPIRHEHIHLFLPEAAIPEAQAWYAKNFGAKPGERAKNPVADIPGVQMRFAKSATPAVTTKGRILDHIGFDVQDIDAFTQKLAAAGIKLDRPINRNEKTRDALAFIYDPWGTYIELNERHSQ